MLSTLVSTRLRLVPFARDDIAVLHALWTDADVRRHLWDDMVIPLARAAETVEAALAAAEQGVGMWTVRALHEPDTVIGFCGLRYLPDGNHVELLYGLLPRFWRRGLATEAAGAVLQYAFNELALERVFAGADSGNARSFGVLERLGMTQVPGGIANVPGVRYYVAVRPTDLRGSGATDSMRAT